MLPRTRARLAAGAPVTIVLYGDSISEVGRTPDWYGGATSVAANWGGQLGQLLGAAHPAAVFHLRYFGIGGQNTYEGLGRLDWLGELAPDLVLVAFGANDCGWHFLPPTASAQALDALLAGIGERYGADAAVIGAGGDNPRVPFMEHLPETLAAMRDAAERRQVPFVDVRAAMLRATADGTHWSTYHNGTRNCHPNDRGHRVWAEAVFTTLLPLLPAADASAIFGHSEEGFRNHLGI